MRFALLVVTLMAACAEARRDDAVNGLIGLVADLVNSHRFPVSAFEVESLLKNSEGELQMLSWSGSSTERLLRWSFGAGGCFVEFSPFPDPGKRRTRVGRATAGCRSGSRLEAVNFLVMLMRKIEFPVDPPIAIPERGDLAAVARVKTAVDRKGIEVQLLEIEEGWEASLTITADGPRAVLRDQ